MSFPSYFSKEYFGHPHQDHQRDVTQIPSALNDPGYPQTSTSLPKNHRPQMMTVGYQGVIQIQKWFLSNKRWLNWKNAVILLMKVGPVSLIKSVSNYIQLIRCIQVHRKSHSTRDLNFSPVRNYWLLQLNGIPRFWDAKVAFLPIYLFWLYSQFSWGRSITYSFWKSFIHIFNPCPACLTPTWFQYYKTRYPPLVTK